MGRILIHLIPYPWLFGPSSAFPSSPRLTSTATPLSVYLRTGYDAGKVVVRCTLSSLRASTASVIPSQAGRAQHVTWEIQGVQAPPSPVHVLCGSWCGGCHLRELSICLWLRWQAQEKGRYLAQLPHSNLSLDYYFSGWWEGEPGSGWITESQGRSPGTFETCTCPASISMSEKEAFHSKKQTSWLVERNCREGGKLDTLRALFFMFLNKISTFFFCPTLQIAQPVL